MSLIQRALRGGAKLDALCAQYGLKATRGHRFPNLISIKYSQVDSPMSEQLVRECRGLVLDEADDWRCVARGFDKFFNYGEGHAAEIDWPTARVQEKLDGSLCMLYAYRDEWHVATSGTPDASGSVGDVNITFADLFWRTASELGIDLTWELRSGYTYLFELCCPENRIIVQHEAPSLTLIGVRDPLTGIEYMPAHIAPHLPRVQEFPLSTISDVLASLDAINPLEQEGYVVVDGRFSRVKVKSPQYVALHHLKGELSERALLEVARSGEIPELVAAFPELAARVEAIRAALDALVAEMTAEYEAIQHIESQRDFALLAQKTRCPGALFAIRSGKAASFRDVFAGMHIDNLARLLTVEEVAIAQRRKA